MFFRAYIYFMIDRDEFEHDTDIIYEADDLASACYDARKWFENRHGTIPDWFKSLNCIKVHELKPQRVGENGYLNPSSYQFFEWKCDWIGTFEDWVGMMTKK